MFDSLSDKLGGIFDKLRGKGALTEDDVNAAAREIRVALLEADVALPVVKEFIEIVKSRAIGADVIKSVSPTQQVVKIVHDAMVEMLGGHDGEQELNLKAATPAAFLMVGLQGSGKTTSTAKISKFLTDKHKKKMLMASLDTQRPAAQEQLKVLGEQTGIDTLEIIKGQSPIEITKRAMNEARLGGYDIVMLDTAGRLSIDKELMAEVAEISKLANPTETLLVVDAMTGQDAVNVAREFDEKVGITGIMMTRIDGDARGGAAMSMRGITGKPIKLMGTGEQWDKIEPFHPDRIAGRILGMGDVVSLVEKAQESLQNEDAAAMAEKFKKGQFDFNDMLMQMRQMTKMGGAGALMKMLPGLGKMAKQIEEANLDDTILKRHEAIILSMTKAEREKPALLNASRKKRIAAGAGTTVQEINKICKQQQQMAAVMKKIKKMGMGGMMKQMKSLMGGKGEELELMAQSMDPDNLGRDMAALKGNDILGANPFDGAGAPSGLPGLGGGMPGLAGLGGGQMGGMPGMPTRGGTKKNRKPKVKKGKRK
ncbi:MAG: signal recognition particle protein [Alphaproteobacteria bacterium]|nr:signal recognition particle protein [Alphaproteobacteria bacterium]NCQ87790.1 signal recognition particle protein [Alphaproteobacteria bacterium]NCT05702.1 signal recognition particle protein [Alphaproteobacteria bacterium]